MRNRSSRTRAFCTRTEEVETPLPLQNFPYLVYKVVVLTILTVSRIFHESQHVGMHLGSRFNTKEVLVLQIALSLI